MNWRLINSDVIDGLRQLPDASVHCCVTSPPYLWQRDYNCEGQIGLENSIEEYVQRLLTVFAEVRRVLRPDGTLWVNIADGYTNDTKWGGKSGHMNADSAAGGYQRIKRSRKSGLPPKCLMAIPARFQTKMIDVGWICRNEIIWHKPTARPESMNDRCSRDHEQVFLFSKSPKYYFDQEAIKQPASPKTVTVKTYPRKGNGNDSAGESLSLYHEQNGRYYVEERNLRTVWSIPSGHLSEEHYAAFPTALPALCISAGTSEWGCCVTCGAPWRRVVERIKGEPASFNGSSFTKGKTATALNGHAPVGQSSRTLRTETKGWKPSCGCDHVITSDPSPCTVLDPFCGTSTTGVAALKLGRHFIGIDLNADYIAISERRMRGTQIKYYGSLFVERLLEKEAK